MNNDAKINLLINSVAKIQDELAILSNKFNALEKSNEEVSNGLREAINKINTKIDTLKEDVKHDLDLLFATDDAQGAINKDLNERLEAIEDTVHEIVDDLTDCDEADSDCECCGCKCQCHEEVPTVEEVVSKADKSIEILVGRIFNNWLDKYLKYIGSNDKLLFATWLASIHNQLINFCIEEGAELNIDPYELFEYIVSIGVSYDIKWSEFDGIMSAMKAWLSSSEKIIIHGNWVVLRTNSLFPNIKKLQSYDC